MVADEIYLASLSRAVTREEVWLRDVLVFHRCYLNGGLCNAIEIQADSLDSVLEGYDVFGLRDFAEIIRVVVAQPCPDDMCTCQASNTDYHLKTYGLRGDQSDAVETALAERLKSARRQFNNLLNA